MSNKKKIWIAAGGVVVLGAIIYFSIRATRKDETMVQTARVERREVLKSKVSASGQIRAKEFVDLQSEIAGVIIDLPVREGNNVKKGDVLLRIDPIQTDADTAAINAQFDAAMTDARSQEFAIMNADSNLARDEALLRSSKADLEQAESYFGRMQNSFKRKQQLHEEGLISREDYEMAQDDFKGSKTKLDSARAKVSQSESQIQVSKNNIEQMKVNLLSTRNRARSSAANLTKSKDLSKKTTLLSPLTGVITQLVVEKGERAVPGNLSNPQATLMTIADLSTIQAELKVDETDIVNLHLGDTTQVKVDALPDVLMEGEVTEIGNSPIKTASSSTQQEAKDFKVIVTIKNPSPKLRPGMSCTGDIITDTKHNVLVVPIQALTVREVEVDKDGKYVEPDLRRQMKDSSVARADSLKAKPKKKELQGLFVVNKEKVVRFRPVKTGITGDSEIEVMEAMNQDEEIVSGSFQTLRTIKDGTAVKIDNAVKTQSEKKS